LTYDVTAAELYVILTRNKGGCKYDKEGNKIDPKCDSGIYIYAPDTEFCDTDDLINHFWYNLNEDAKERIKIFAEDQKSSHWDKLKSDWEKKPLPPKQKTKSSQTS